MGKLIFHYDIQSGVVVPEGKVLEYAQRYINTITTSPEGSTNEIWIGQYAMMVAIRLLAFKQKVTEHIVFVAEDSVQYGMNQYGAVHAPAHLFTDVACDLTTDLLLFVHTDRNRISHP